MSENVNYGIQHNAQGYSAISRRKDGGQAFPHDYVNEKGWPDFEAGMTLRDYFATHAQAAASAADDIDFEFAEKMLGRECPDWDKDPIGNATFWADLRAKMRYIEADAMLRAREAS
jgi:hypothetical protein